LRYCLETGVSRVMKRYFSAQVLKFSLFTLNSLDPRGVMTHKSGSLLLSYGRLNNHATLYWTDIKLGINTGFKLKGF
jgi:hypothetical protein